jgi:hypothetical protein
MLKKLLLCIVATSSLIHASQQEERPLSPRTQAKIEEAKQELTKNLTKIERAYIAAIAAQHLIENNPRAWLFMQGVQALQACTLQENFSRTDHIQDEILQLKQIQNIMRKERL